MNENRETFELVAEASDLAILRALKDWVRWLGLWFVVFFLILQAVNVSPLFRDDTDPGTSWGDSRSGIKPATDALTGCQYLLSPKGGIAPRLDARGQHVGCAQ